VVDSDQYMSCYTLLATCDDFVVIDKQPGISVHKDDQLTGLTMRLSEDLGESVFLVHRLDKVTSGVMIFARHSLAAAKLSALFRERQVNKYYLALSDKKPAKKQGSVKGDMVRSRRATWRLATTVNNPAVTRFFSQAVDPGKRLFLLKPETGKTHQIRVAMKSISAPIVGDALYASSLADRTYLHAWQLHFRYDGQDHHYRSDPAEGEFFLTQSVANQLAVWGDPQQLPWPKS